MPKAASSSLQVTLSNVKELSFLGLYPTKNIAEFPQNKKTFDKDIPYLKDQRILNFYKNFSLSSYNEEEQKELFQEIVEHYSEPDKTCFFSLEALTSPIFSEVSPELKLSRLIKCCPNAEFLIIVRNQLGLIKSQYRDWPFRLINNQKMGEPITISEWCQYELKKGVSMSPLKWFDYQLIASIFLKYHKKLHVLCFENFVSKDEIFFEELSEILAVDKESLLVGANSVHSNLGISKRYNNLRRLRKKFKILKVFSLFIPTIIKNHILQYINRGPKEELTISEGVLEQLKKYFINNNEEFNKENNYKLDKKGYWL